MLAYSGKGRLLVEGLDLDLIARRWPRLLEVSISKRVALDYQSQPDLPAVEADAAQIQQVIMNLVTNAAESIGEPGRADHHHHRQEPGRAPRRR